MTSVLVIPQCQSYKKWTLPAFSRFFAIGIGRPVVIEQDTHRRALIIIELAG